MVPDVNRLLAISSAMLRDVCGGGRIQAPQNIFIKAINTFPQTDLNTIGQEVVLAEKIFFFDARIEVGIIIFA